MAQPQRVHTTMRVNGANVFGLGSPQPPTDTIYYLRTSTPHLHDLSLIGPFHVLDAMVPSLRAKLRDESPAGLQMLDEMMAASRISAFEHINAPLPGLGNHKMRIELIREKNPEVLAILPGPVWLVVISEPLQGAQLGPIPKLKSQRFHGTFISAEKAKEAARELLRNEW